jgi:CheY-like chemotaxis protein
VKPHSIFKVLITDDHNLVRIGSAHLLARLLPGAAVLHAVDRLETLQLVRSHPDLGLLVVDLALADSPGLRIVEDVQAALAPPPALPPPVAVKPLPAPAPAPQTIAQKFRGKFIANCDRWKITHLVGTDGKRYWISNSDNWKTCEGCRRPNDDVHCRSLADVNSVPDGGAIDLASCRAKRGNYWGLRQASIRPINPSTDEDFRAKNARKPRQCLGLAIVTW